MRIYLIRHARQNSAFCNVNVPLADYGIIQAHLAGERLTKYDIDAIYASDLIRAKETAEIIKQELDAYNRNNNIERSYQIAIRKELREIDFGDLEGKSDEENKVAYKEFFAERDRLEEDLPFPNGECGEDVIRRVRSVFRELETQNVNNVVIVTHGGAIRAALSYLLKMAPVNRLLISLSLENTSITEVYYDEASDRYYVERINDYAHLEDKPELLRRNWAR